MSYSLGPKQVAERHKKWIYHEKRPGSCTSFWSEDFQSHTAFELNGTEEDETVIIPAVVYLFLTNIY